MGRPRKLLGAEVERAVAAATSSAAGPEEKRQ
jgi:hypothetical protein